MVNTIVDGAFRQTNLTNESSEYLGKREELRLAEIELMRQRERVAELRRHLPQGALLFRIISLKKARAISTLVTRPCTPFASVNSSPNPIAPSSSITSCTESGRPRLARCALLGSTAPTACPITSLRISISQWSPPLMSPLCAPTLARAAGTSRASLAPATARSNRT